MLDEPIMGVSLSFLNSSLKKLRFFCKKIEWDNDGGLIWTDGPTVLCILFKKNE